MDEFQRIKQLPPYVFNLVDALKKESQQAGIHVMDFAMGNPDLPTPTHIVEALQRASCDSSNHRYSSSIGILPLREAISDWYYRRYQVNIDPQSESVVSIGSKEGLTSLAMALTGPGDTVLVPTPCYPIHTYGFVIAGSNAIHVPLSDDHAELLARLEDHLVNTQPKPKVLLLNFPANPTTQCVNLAFFEKIVALAKQYQVYIIHDFAYADLCFDGYRAPSILQVAGAKDIAVETFTLSKSYNMPGWRVGFVNGNQTIIKALTRIKSYTDYGNFAPIQHAAVAALNGSQDCVSEITEVYRQRRDALCDGLKQAGWEIAKPKATMFVWAKIPALFQDMGSLAFCEYLIRKAHVAVSPGIGFGDAGDQYVRFGLVQDLQTTANAIEMIGMSLRDFDASQTSQVA